MNGDGLFAKWATEYTPNTLGDAEDVGNGRDGLAFADY
jgi:hypothetical protein